MILNLFKRKEKKLKCMVCGFKIKKPIVKWVVFTKRGVTRAVPVHAHDNEVCRQGIMLMIDRKREEYLVSKYG